MFYEKESLRNVLSTGLGQFLAIVDAAILLYVAAVTIKYV